MNSDAYFSCPVAVQRRLPYIVEIEPLEQYCRMENNVSTGMLDPSRIEPSLAGEYPNVWKITMKHVYASHDHNQGIIEPIATFTDINEFLGFWGSILKTKEEERSNDDSATKSMTTVTVCQGCLKPTLHCSCAQVQSGEYSSEELLHDIDPETWVNLQLNRIRSGEWVRACDVEEVQGKLGIEGSLQGMMARVQHGTIEIVPEIFTYTDIFSDSLEQVHFDKTCDAYLQAKQTITEGVAKTYSVLRICAGNFVENSTSFLGFVAGVAIHSIFSIAEGINGRFKIVKNSVIVKVCATYDSFCAFSAQKQTLICAMARSMARGTKIVWDKATEPLVAYATMRIGCYSLKVLKEQFSTFGHRVASSINDPKIWVFLAVLAAAYPVYKVVSSLMTPSVQGQEASSIPVDNQSNLWKDVDEFRLCPIDLGKKSMGSHSQGYDETLKKVHNNVVYIQSECEGRNPIFGKAVCLVGHLYMTPGHILRSDTQFVTVTDSDCGSQKLKSSLKYKIDMTQVRRDDGTDMCFFHLFSTS